jgi:hypothetical protein
LIILFVLCFFRAGPPFIGPDVVLGIVPVVWERFTVLEFDSGE